VLATGFDSLTVHHAGMVSAVETRKTTMENTTTPRYELMQDTYECTDWETGKRIVRTEWLVWDTVLGTPKNWYNAN
jgi:hypothetical protein